MAVPNHFENVTQAKAFVRFLIERGAVGKGAFNVIKIISSSPRTTYGATAKARARADHAHQVFREASRLAEQHYELYQVWCVSQRLAGKMKGAQ